MRRRRRSDLRRRGAFTGAVAQKKGKIEVADGGTLFLDEIGELALTLQAKLLRVLQERVFDRVGGTKPIKVDIRLIAATNRNLEEALKSGLFRQDLFYRLNVVSVTMPALRDRREDIPLLATYFVQKYSRIANRPVTGISPEAHSLLRPCKMFRQQPAKLGARSLGQLNHAAARLSGGVAAFVSSGPARRSDYRRTDRRYRGASRNRSSSRQVCRRWVGRAPVLPDRSSSRSR